MPKDPALAGMLRARLQHMSLISEKVQPTLESDDLLVSTLDDFARHLRRGDATAAAALWDVPALLLGDFVVHGPLSAARLAELLSEATGPATGSAALPSATLERVEWASERVARVDTGWPGGAQTGLFDAVAATTFYLRVDELSHPRIRALILRASR